LSDTALLVGCIDSYRRHKERFGPVLAEETGKDDARDDGALVDGDEDAEVVAAGSVKEVPYEFPDERALLFSSRVTEGPEKK
jgi:hypothetical protein